ncbi:amino acid ABC transporter membrane protein, PAAT family [Desulfonispora thiosulfatigenes DSM 11270]|uniref:Amino acid ABC transporter membrane protein, PAAT family n=1 Tax=Desulfonispora thiosulfatigenes DSM 11270 TaxID=656914 RepID=A0A1W1V121_DESTI|nr:amino acid ABC transporter permease [Desulfonispora thiosulfatigenes]SMB86714.1 amino acid ABC transporter membrane protein, PAAT family [Desulfonispora thiosulfatigenes DSM 11270]
MATGFVWDWAFTIKVLPLLLKGAVTTVALTFFAIIIGTVIGLSVALIKINKNPILNYLGAIYTWIFRGIPLLVQLFIIYYALPIAVGIDFSPFTAAVMAISLCGGAYIAEIIRAGIQSVDKGQMEAALSLGMSHSQAMKRIIIPQTYRRLIPPMGNEFITLLKDTALVSTISMIELLRTAQIHASSSFKPFEMYLTAGAIYLVLTTFFTVIFGILENKLARSE